MESNKIDLSSTTLPQPVTVVVPQTVMPAEVEPAVATQISEVVVEAQPRLVDEAASEAAPELVDETDGMGEDELLESDEPTFQWQASEYVQHHKGVGWYLGLVAIVLILLGVAFINQQWLGIAVLLVMAIAVVVYANKPPRILTYMLDFKGITIESKFYAYDQFRSFSVLQDSEWHAIDLEPTQRFMPRLTIIFVSEDLDGIVEHLSLHLPRTDRQPDLIERLTRYVRF